MSTKLVETEIIMDQGPPKDMVRKCCREQKKLVFVFSWF